MKLKLRLTLIILLCHSIGFAQDSLVLADNEHFREELNAEYRNPEESPLEKKDLENFTELPFFDIDPSFRVEARFELKKKIKTFKMKTTTDRRPVYAVYGIAYFELEGVEYQLNIYQSQSLKERVEFKDYLFLPFTDNTNGNSSYGGGRFIDLSIPDGETIVIDFNKAYNPYCAYSDRYSCPIPPKENYLDLEVNAGVKYQAK